MRCGGKEEKVVRKSPGMLIYGATPLLSQSARVLAHVQDRKSPCRATPLLSSSSHVACVAGTRALWDRSGVAPYISMPGDFRTTFSSSLFFHIIRSV